MKGLFIPDITVEMFRNGCLEAIEELMAVGEIYDIEYEPEQNWIPCSERLPEENKEVLVSLAWGIDIGEYRDGNWHSEWINHYDDDDVLAWMPLPEPYKEGDADDAH